MAIGQLHAGLLNCRAADARGDFLRARGDHKAGARFCGGPCARERDILRRGHSQTHTGVRIRRVVGASSADRKRKFPVIAANVRRVTSLRIEVSAKCDEALFLLGLYCARLHFLPRLIGFWTDERLADVRQIFPFPPASVTAPARRCACVHGIIF
ncbi:hypothetical protein EVAR_18389_1 [Eumeta japonica]|uniref:Uncharacterized protein n=1 Tax=Eumeta variegata TaxID=151549 RepID=A0A4C1UUD1_EUMVA|nr:hypothetical protein EVAR_18389_1 [Eumeta japonica]